MLLTGGRVRLCQAALCGEGFQPSSAMPGVSPWMSCKAKAGQTATKTIFV